MFKRNVLSILLFVLVSCKSSLLKREERAKLVIKNPVQDQAIDNGEEIALEYNDKNGNKRYLFVPISKRPSKLIIKNSANIDDNKNEMTLADNKLNKDSNFKVIQPDHFKNVKTKLSYLKSIEILEALFKEKKYTKALIQIAPLLNSYPENARLFIMQGTLLTKIGEILKAIKSYESALKLRPDDSNLEEKIIKLKDQVGVLE